MKTTRVSSLVSVMMLILAISFSSATSAQDVDKLKSANEVIWFGLDFTKAKMIGSTDAGFTNPDAIVNQFFGSWNHLILNEPKKYDLAGALSKSIKNDIKTVEKRNAEVAVEGLVTYDINKLTEADLKEYVAQYSAEGEGIGLLFAIENFDKTAKKVRLYAVFFDVQSHEILKTQYYQQNATGGFGFRNYWASGIYQVIKKMKKDYPTW